MGRNLLLGTQSLYAWSGSDTRSVSDISVPGKFVQTGSATTANAYLWVDGRTCVPDASRNLHKMDDWMTLSLDVKVSGRTSGTVEAGYDLRQTGLNAQKDATTTSITGCTDWTRVSLPVHIDIVKTEAQIRSLFLVQCRGCNQGTTVEWKNMKLEIGPEGSDFTPAPEDITYYSPKPEDFEQGNILMGSVDVGKTYQQCKQASGIRVRSKELMPVHGRFFSFNVPTSLKLYIIAFGASGQIGLVDGAKTASGMTLLPAGTTGVAIALGKPDDSTIAVSDVTSVSGGGC